MLKLKKVKNARWAGNGCGNCPASYEAYWGGEFVASVNGSAGYSGRLFYVYLVGRKGPRTFKLLRDVKAFLTELYVEPA